MKKLIIGALLGWHGRKYYLAFRYMKENPNDPLVVKLRDQWNDLWSPTKSERPASS